MQKLVAALALFAAGFAAYGQQAQPAGQSAVLPAGITLPRTGIAFAIERKAGESSLVALHATEVVSNSHAGGNFARSQVFMNLHATVELPGTNAGVVLEGQPSLLVRINTDDPDLARRRVQLIRLEKTKERRVVSKYSQNVFGGGRQRTYDTIATTKGDVDPDVWLMLTPNAPLTPGEYGIVMMPKDVNFSVESVYDFSIGDGKAKPEK